jgi:predicted Fe-Mo cluster-binding NifX family protein
MKIAVSSTGKDLKSRIDPHFGRCAFFIIVETDDMSFQVFDNENMALGGGAGIQAAGFLSINGVKAVLTGNCGPNAMKTFSAAGILVFTGMTGTVLQAVEKFKQGGLTPSIEPTVTEKSGIAKIEATGIPTAGNGIGRCAGGTGRGMEGGGRGMGGRCMGGTGRGMGIGRGFAIKETGASNLQAPEKEASLAQLKEQAAEMQRQIDMIQEKIKKIQHQ